MKFMPYLAAAGLLLAAAPRPLGAAPDPAPSLQSLFADGDCESEPKLVGNWTGNTDLGGVWTLQTLGERKYRLVEQREESTAGNRRAFDLCVAHLGGHLFFDATYQEVDSYGKEVRQEDFWVPLHLIGRLDVEKNALHFRLLENEWLQDALKSGRIRTTTTQDDEGRHLLTGPSKELKEFAAHIAREAKAFAFDENFERVAAKEDAKKN